MRRSTRVLLWGAGLVLLCWAAVMLFLHTLDAEIYRRALERELSALLAREVTIGALAFDLSLRPTLAARELRIANPAWASRPALASAAAARARIDLVALWHGRVELRALQVDGLDLLLERNAQGTGNWVFDLPDGGDGPVDLPDFDQIVLTGAQIGFRGSQGALRQVRVERAEATIRDDAPFVLSASAIYRESPVNLSVKSDLSLQAALNGKPWQLSAQFAPQGAYLALDARLPTLDSLEGAELSFEAHGERLGAWSALVQRPLPAWGPYQVAARLRGAGGAIEVDSLRLSLDGLPMRPARIEIETGSATLGSQTNTRLAVQGRLGEAPFSLEAASAPLSRLADSGEAVPLEASARLGDLALRATGTLSLSAGVPAIDLALTARGDALAPARVFAAAQHGRALPVNLSAHLSRTPERLALSDIRGSVLGCTVTGALAYSAAPRPALSGTLALGRLDLAQPDVAALNAAQRSPPAPQAGMPPAWLREVDADLRLRAAAIDGLPVSARNLAAQVELRAGVLTLHKVSATLADVDLSGSGALRWNGARPHIDAQISVPVLDAAQFDTGGEATGGEKTGSVVDAPLPLAPLRALDGTLELSVGRIVGTAVPLATLRARATLQRGNLAIDPVSFAAAGVAIDARATLDASGSAWRVAAQAHAPKVNVEHLLRTLGRPGTATGMIENVRLAIDTQGASLRALLAGARVRVHSDAFAVKQGPVQRPIEVQRVRVEADPGGPLRMLVAGRAFGTPMELGLTGGPLAELLEPARAWPKLELDMRAALRGESLHVVATTGPLQRVIAMRDVSVVVEATLPGARGTFEGSIEQLTDPAGRPFTGRADIASLARTAALFTGVRLPDVPVAASGRLVLGQGEISFEDLEVKAGRSDARGSLRVRWRERAELAAELRSTLIDTTEWLTADSDATPILDRRIPTQALLRQDVRLRLQSQRLILPRYDLAQVEANAKLDQGLLELSGRAAEGDLHAELRFETRVPVPSLAGRLMLHEFDTRTLYTAAPHGGATGAPPMSIQAQVAASGSTPREMLASAKGEVLITAGPGTLPLGESYGLERIAGNVLLTLVPGRRTEDFSRLECAAARFAIANGVATSTDGIALRFKPLDILGSGAINLRDGRILFGYRAVRRDWWSFSVLGLTSGLTGVTGTIAEPKVALDPSGLLIQGTAAWATVGISVLAGDLWRKLEATGQPCTRIAAGARASSDPLDLLIRALPAVTLPTPAPAQR